MSKTIFEKIRDREVHAYPTLEDVPTESDLPAKLIKAAQQAAKELGISKNYHALALFALNRIFRQMQFLSYVVYDENDNAMESDSFPFAPDEYQEIPPDVIISQIYDFVMLYYHTVLESPRTRLGLEWNRLYGYI